MASSVTTSSFDVANAADYTTSYSKVYLPSPQYGKVVVITGDNAGLGHESKPNDWQMRVPQLYSHSRDGTKGQKAELDEVNECLSSQKDDESFAGKAMVPSLDLCDLDNDKSFNNRLSNVIGKDTKIDVLVKDIKMFQTKLMSS